jgi:tetratricopeptide (TPR) repeat protein
MGTTDKLLPILFHTRNYHVMRGDFTPAFAVVEEMRALGKSSSDSSALLLGNWLEAEMRCWRGDFSEARRLGNAAIALYDPKKHAQLVHVYNQDPNCSTLVWAGLWLWALGFPDQARETAEEELRLARKIGHTWNLVWVLASGNFALTLCGDMEQAKARLVEALAVASAHGLPVLHAIALWHHGIACIASGEHEQGYVEATAGSKVMWDSGVLITSPYSFSERAKALLGLGRLREARTLVDEALRLIDVIGDRMWEAEAHRISGLIALAASRTDIDAAEKAFSKSLEIARAQQAKGWELRTATSYARLMQATGRAPAAKELLQPIYDWFTEGFDTRDLVEAKKLLGELR